MDNLENIKSKIKLIKVDSFIKIAIGYQIFSSSLFLTLRLALGYTDRINLSLVSIPVWIAINYFVLNRFKNGGNLSKKILQFWYFIGLISPVLYLIQFFFRAENVNDLYVFTINYSLLVSPLMFAFSAFAFYFVSNYHLSKKSK